MWRSEKIRFAEKTSARLRNFYLASGPRQPVVVSHHLRAATAGFNYIKKITSETYIIERNLYIRVYIIFLFIIEKKDRRLCNERRIFDTHNNSINVGTIT